MDTPTIFEQMPDRYRKGSVSAPVTYYFSIDSHKYTVSLGPDTCEVSPGKTTDSADVVLKTTSKIWENMVLHGKLPGPIDIARGKIKTNDPAALAKLKDYFQY